MWTAGATVTQLATKEPVAYLDYTESVAAAITDPVSGVVDPLASLSLSAAPSGAGELMISRLSVDQTGLLATFWTAGGMPGRIYTLSLVATTQSGRVFQWLLSLPIDPALLFSWPPPDPPSAGFGTAITWAAT